MVHERLLHDAAFATATSILGCIENCLRPEEHATAFDEIYQRVKGGIEAYLAFTQRQQEQLNPLGDWTTGPG